MGFPLQSPARPHPVQIAIDVELQEIAGRITRPPRRLRFDPREPGGRKIEPLNEGVDKPHRIVGLDVSSTASGNNRNWSRPNPAMWSHGDSNVANAARESAQTGFPHGL